MICNYVIDTPIGIWPLILYCFLLAVPGDIALSVLGAVIAKRVRPVVLQYLFDSKSNVRLEREELGKMNPLILAQEIIDGRRITRKDDFLFFSPVI